MWSFPVATWPCMHQSGLAPHDWFDLADVRGTLTSFRAGTIWKSLNATSDPAGFGRHWYRRVGGPDLYVRTTKRRKSTTHSLSKDALTDTPPLDMGVGRCQCESGPHLQQARDRKLSRGAEAVDMRPGDLAAAMRREAAAHCDHAKSTRDSNRPKWYARHTVDERNGRQA
ncbi:hypothetical protein GCM10023094_33870 [Rhodococcus olei]|uniref:Uncharacterized protein n=1 Tax=Rhodococcus olei TaxID=2161675 RepID=A0ABP8PA85_9NOCA